MSTKIDPVEEVLPISRLLALGLQHVLVMYAGAIVVPLVIGRALNLPSEDVAFLISADLFACGLATLVQCIGFPGVGLRLPVMMGVTFTAVAPVLAMAATPGVGLAAIYGAVIAAGIFGIIAAPFVSRLLPLFPPVVTGTIILVIGITLMPVGINWAGVGLPTLTRVVDGVAGSFPNPDFGQLPALGLSLFVLLFILGLIKWGSGLIANLSVLLGIIAGAILASALGVMHFDKVDAAPWLHIVTPLRFGIPQFHLVPVMTMCIVMLVTILLLLGVLPKLAALIEAVPPAVLGGAGLVMFGMIAASGARILANVDFKHNQYNLFVVATSLGIGMIPLAAPGLFQYLPHYLQPLLDSGILLCAVAAVLLNAFFNVLGENAGAKADKAVGPRCREALSQTQLLQQLVPNRSVARKLRISADSHRQVARRDEICAQTRSLSTCPHPIGSRQNALVRVLINRA